MKVTAVIAAGGSGSRMGADVNKMFLQLNGKTILEHTMDVFLKCNIINKIIVVAAKEDITRCTKLFCSDKVEITQGGKTRQQSVYNGICRVTDEIVAIHDGARALVKEKYILKAIEECKIYGAAALGVSCTDTLKRADEKLFIADTVDRSGIYRIQTPQVFFTKDIKRAHEMAVEENFLATDDCALYEKYIGKVKIVPSDEWNLKITFPEDLAIAKMISDGTQEKI